ncbi:UDP-N-acetylmuramoyl-L-alanyl-D-glutamate--2,6-diaminopimelate ligase [Candidatus Saccharibacteria bacterium TM7i]|nr:UDP-N-acetylmuramoyl-L-alanyl-D-glutamate--2,6-diaminopimelate ligase [Candidatus Saccharibacteria bacterium TM7i]
MNIRKIVKSIIPKNLFRKIEPFGHLIEAVLANIRYGFPARKLRIIGVTGTNGKTTTSFFIHRMLHEAGVPVALMSTVANGMGAEIETQQEHATTARAFVLQRRMREYAKRGAKWIVVETSSHALAQHRVWGIPYEVAVMTNVTGDHLDYHGTFEHYRDAKRKLFKIANRNENGLGVVNYDDKNANLFASDVKRAVTYGIQGGELQASDLELSSTHTKYIATTNDETYNITLNIPGEFNVSNSLAAIAVGRHVGLGKEQIENGLAALRMVEGRMNTVDEGQPFGVIVDFASTPDGFEQFFSSVRPLTKGKLIAVFGSAGRRDEAKRAVQGGIAAKYADTLVITEEDDRDVDGNEILEQIAEGARKKGAVDDTTLFKVLDRTEAIRKAFDLATSEDDTVVLLGKGHERTIERADGEHDWNETEVARTLLRERATQG